jgi:hypothetical protein
MIDVVLVVCGIVLHFVDRRSINIFKDSLRAAIQNHDLIINGTGVIIDEDIPEFNRIFNVLKQHVLPRSDYNYIIRDNGLWIDVISVEALALNKNRFKVCSFESLDSDSN